MLSEILSNQRRKVGMSVDELAEKSGVPKSTVAKILTGVTDNPTLETVKAIAHTLGISLSDAAGEKEKEREKEKQHKASDVERDIIYKIRKLDEFGKNAVNAILQIEYERCLSINEPATQNGSNSPVLVEYRRYINPAAAGAPLWAESEYEIILRDPDTVPMGADYAVGIQGASMEPAIPNKATVWVQRSERPANGDIVIAWVEGAGTVCKQAICNGDQVVRLHSVNPNYPDIVGNDLEGLRIYGTVVGIDTQN